MRIDLKTPVQLPEPPNPENSVAFSTDGKHGLCAAWHYPDDLDARSLEFAKYIMAKKSACHAADLGASCYMPQAIRFAQIGGYADAFDFAPPMPEYESVRAELGARIRYHQADLANLPPMENLGKYDLVYSNRLIGFLPFAAAKEMIAFFSRLAVPGARFFLSFHSLDSSLAENYPDAAKKIENRFAPAINVRTIQYQITAPLCLYQKSDIEGAFLSGLPLRVADQWQSDSGTYKYVFERY